MFSRLSPKQHRIVFNKDGHFVVRACPGSGKTLTVAARLAYRMQVWSLKHQGIAALSFTNVAWEEIKKKLENDFYTTCRYPHFLGTIDSFINQYIFLPFGHLFMNCVSRPVLVGEPHGHWSGPPFYEQYFDKVSLDISGFLIKTAPIQSVPVPLIKNGLETKHVTNLIKMKQKYWGKGFTTQDDANYIAMKLLEKYPDIARAIGFRFPEFIIDEAQDTSEIQMKIIDLLLEKEIKQIMIVGDPDQAIFEWRQANPKLFEDKYNVWENNSEVLNENWRSSQLICNCSHPLSRLDSPSLAVNNNVRAFAIKPELITYADNDISDVVSSFVELCRQHGIIVNSNNAAIVYRSKSFGSKINRTQIIETKEQPWLPGEPLAKDFAEGKYLWDNGNHKDGFRKIEKGFVKYMFGRQYCTKDQLQDITERIGFANWRKSIYQLINTIPKAEGLLLEWIETINNQPDVRKCFIKLTKQMKVTGLKTLRSSFRLKVDEDKGKVTFKDLFAEQIRNLSAPYHIGTVHSVKGETFEAILLFLGNKAGNSLYRNFIQKDINTLAVKAQEEIRIVYVAMTRPRKILVIAVPSDEDLKAWEKKLCL